MSAIYFVTPVRDMTQDWQGQKTRAKLELATRIALSLIFFTPLKIITVGLLKTPFDYTNYSDNMKVGKIKDRLLASALKDIEHDRHPQHKERSVLDLWPYEYDFRKYSLSNLARYKILDHSDVITIKQLLKEAKFYNAIIEQNAPLYHAIKNKMAPSYVRNVRQIAERYSKAVKMRKKVEAKWIIYRDVVIKSRLPIIEIDF